MTAVPMFRNASILLVAACVAAGPAFAEKPEWAGQGGKGKNKHEAKAGKEGRQGAKGGPAAEVKVGAYFSDKDRSNARSYYSQRYGSGKSCPPGLAKKNNGCLPPGQAKKYAVGQPLPAGVVYYPVPHAVLVQLPPAPAGHKYVRVATDILLIAVGSSMVVDAISDLMRM
jgi:hypothetical protein